MKNIVKVSVVMIVCSHPLLAAVEEQVQRPVNIAALITFVVFMILTLCITTWAARRTRSRKDYYVAGGEIGGIQNGFAIAGDEEKATERRGGQEVRGSLRFLDHQ